VKKIQLKINSDDHADCTEKILKSRNQDILKHINYCLGYSKRGVRCINIRKRYSSRISRGRRYPTLIIFIPRHHYIPLHTPVHTPTVFNQPVIFTTHGTIPYHQHGMVKLG
jgi:hypothetical protein